MLVDVRDVAAILRQRSHDPRIGPCFRLAAGPSALTIERYIRCGLHMSRRCRFDRRFRRYRWNGGRRNRGWRMIATRGGSHGRSIILGRSRRRARQPCQRKQRSNSHHSSRLHRTEDSLRRVRSAQANPATGAHARIGPASVRICSGQALRALVAHVIAAGVHDATLQAMGFSGLVGDGCARVGARRTCGIGFGTTGVKAHGLSGVIFFMA